MDPPSDPSNAFPSPNGGLFSTGLDSESCRCLFLLILLFVFVTMTLIIYKIPLHLEDMQDYARYPSQICIALTLCLAFCLAVSGLGAAAADNRPEMTPQAWRGALVLVAWTSLTMMIMVNMVNHILYKAWWQRISGGEDRGYVNI